MRALAVLCAVGVTGAAQAQTPPSANSIAAVEVAIYCAAVMERADDLLMIGGFQGASITPLQSELDGLEKEYASKLPALAVAAGYSTEQLDARRKQLAEKQSKTSFGSVAALAVRSCLNGASAPQRSTAQTPGEPMALAMAGRSASDVLYVDTGSLIRVGQAVQGWQLYVFKAEQQVGGKPARAQWAPFMVDCLTPTIVTYGAVGLAEARHGAAVSDARAAASVKAVEPNTFGAAAWMIACEVTKPATIHATVEAAAQHAAAVFAAQ